MRRVAFALALALVEGMHDCVHGLSALHSDTTQSTGHGGCAHVTLCSRSRAAEPAEGQARPVPDAGVTTARVHTAKVPRPHVTADRHRWMRTEELHDWQAGYVARACVHGTAGTSRSRTYFLCGSNVGACQPCHGRPCDVGSRGGAMVSIRIQLYGCRVGVR